LENQCEVQDNAYTSVVDGLGKRQPSEHVRRLTEIVDIQGDGIGLTEDETLVHWINRDQTERYAVIVDHALSLSTVDPGIRIFDVLTGENITVTGKTVNGKPSTIDSSVVSYLQAKATGTTKNAKRDLKALTIADTTFLLNTTVKVEMGHDVASGSGLPPSDSFLTSGATPNRFLSKSARRWFLFQRTANALSRYAVEMYSKTGPEHPKPNRWDPWRVEDTDGKRRGLGWVKTFGLEYEKRLSNQRGFGLPTDVPPYDPPNGHYEGYQIPTVQTHEVLERLWSELREPTVAGVPSTEFGYYRGGMESNFNHRRVINDSFIGDQVLIKKRVKPPSTLQTVLPQKGPVMMLELHSTQSVTSKDWREELLLTVDSTGDVEDSLIAFSTEVDRISQLPLTCKHGHIVKITGLEDNSSDEFYAEFEANNENELSDTTNFGLVDGHWKESMAPLSEFRIDQTTMPLKMVRVNDSTTTAGFHFEVYHEDWTDKTVGDEDSNPNPSFVGHQIEELFLWRNRLGFLSDSRFIMSEADEFSNFWRTTVKTLIDSDPIDIDAGHSDVADLRFATPLEEELVLWTDRTQFIVQGNPILTPKTAGLTPATEFEAYPDVRPEVLENGIFYALRSGGGGFSQIRQFHRVADAAGSFTSLRSSEQIPRYIPGKIVEMTATSIESVLATRTDDEDSKHVIYIYKWHDDGPGRRILSSWFRYTVGDTYNTIVHGMKFIEDDLFLIVERKSNTALGVDREFPISLEKITFSGQRQVDTGSTFRCLLDRRITEADVTLDYDTASKSLDIQLPYLVSSTDATSGVAGMKIVSRAGTSTGPEGEQFAFTHVVNTSAAGIDFSVLRVSDPTKVLFNLGSDFKFHVGQDYTMTYQFSRPNIRESQQGRPTQEIATGRFQLLRGTIPYEDTAFMQVDVAPALHSDGSTIVDRTTRSYVVPMLEAGLGRSYVGVVNVRDGRLQFGIRSRPENIRIILTNDTPYPCNPKGIEYESNYSRRSQMGAF
jgi:hypothetical protein